MLFRSCLAGNEVTRIYSRWESDKVFLAADSDAVLRRHCPREVEIWEFSRVTGDQPSSVGGCRREPKKSTEIMVELRLGFRRGNTGQD